MLCVCVWWPLLLLVVAFFLCFAHYILLRRRGSRLRALRGPRRRIASASRSRPPSATSKDELITEIPVRPWGVPAFASASGTAADSTTIFVGLPAGRTYESPDLLDHARPDHSADARRAGPREPDPTRSRTSPRRTPCSRCEPRRPTRRPTAPPTSWRRHRCSATSARCAPPPPPRPPA